MGLEAPWVLETLSWTNRKPVSKPAQTTGKCLESCLKLEGFCLAEMEEPRVKGCWGPPCVASLDTAPSCYSLVLQPTSLHLSFFLLPLFHGWDQGHSCGSALFPWLSVGMAGEWMLLDLLT